MMRVENRETLYSMRLCDLPLRQVDKTLARFKRALDRELAARGIKFAFHLYVSDEWFVPDGVPGIAVPFYVFNKELARIEKAEMGTVEGHDFVSQMRFLRHELGHCLDNAFRLRSDKERQQVFGSPRIPYPTSYKPLKYSRSYVDYLGGNYGQCHPDEDFAETFATWLDPKSHWEKNYTNRKCREKLAFMDRLLKQVAGRRQLVTNRNCPDPIAKNTKTLRQFYRWRQRSRGWRHHNILQQTLMKTIAPSQSTNCLTIAQYLRRERKLLARRLSDQMGVRRYEVEMVIDKTLAAGNCQQVRATKVELRQNAPQLLEKNFRYLSRMKQLKYFL